MSSTETETTIRLDDIYWACKCSQFGDGSNYAEHRKTCPVAIEFDAALEAGRSRAARIEAAARAVVESAGEYPSRPLYADIEALRAALATTER